MREYTIPFVLGYKIWAVAAALFLAEADDKKFDPPKKPKAASSTVKVVDIPPTKGSTRITITTSPTLTDKSLWSWNGPWDDEDSEILLVKEGPNQLILDIPTTPERTIPWKWTAKEPETKQIVLRGKVKAGHGPQPPPGPTPDPPGPKPPTPTPTNGMIDLPGFHVLIRYDRDNTLRPPEEFSILFSESPTSVRQYLKANCPDAPDGPGMRIYPYQSVGVSGAWKKPFERLGTTVPSATISKDGKGWEGSIAGWTPEQFIAKCKEVQAQ